MSVVQVLGDVFRERVDQDAKWGEQNHPDGTSPFHYSRAAEDTKEKNAIQVKHGWLTWTDILEEEVYEAFAEEDVIKLRGELVQVAAVAVAWIQAIDRRAA